jgi:hypothetical protein
MKKVSELVMFTLFFSSLTGIGLTAGFLFYRSMQAALEDCWMKAESIDVNQLVTINDHLQALVTAEDVIASINSQLETVIDNDYGWRHRANVARVKWQNTRKRITARLAVLRQLEREKILSVKNRGMNCSSGP